MLRPRQKLGKYRIQKKIGEGGFARVYRAYDTIEGIPVALKVPRPRLVKKDTLEDLRREVRICASLDHPNILPIKTAMYISRRFVIVYPLGEQTFGDRLRNRMSMRNALDFAGQMIEALAYAHRQRVIHCDVKPENFIMFPNNRIRLADFGIAKIATTRGTLHASGTGTLGYVAPEQAFGKPTLRSDVFSMGVVLFRMFSGQLPEWPFEWPPPGIDRLRQNLPADFVQFIHRCIEVDERKRYRDANQMLSAFSRLKRSALRKTTLRARKRNNQSNGTDWRTHKLRQFRREHGKEFGVRHECDRCAGPISENMKHCPWCGVHHKVYTGPTTFPDRCTRCDRGVKKDWKYCAWCYGPSIGPNSNRAYTDVRYEGKCSNRACSRGDLMPFFRYCPWCRTKVRKTWKVSGTRDRCKRCDNGVLKDYWDYCAWCGLKQKG